MSTSYELEKALERLLDKKGGWSKLDDRPAVGGRPGGVGVGLPGSAPSVGGIVSLEEKDAAAREYFPARMLLTTDGIFAFSESHIKSILLVDDSRFVLKEPPA